MRGHIRVTIKITTHGQKDAPDSVQVLVEDGVGAFLFDCGAAPDANALPPLDGALISHAHPSNTAGIPYLPTATPVYASVMTAAILKATQEITPGPEHEYVYALTGDPSDSPLARVWQQRPYTFLLTQNDSAHPAGEDMDTFSDVHAWWSRPPQHSAALMSSSVISASTMPQFRQRALNRRAIRHYPVDHSILGASAIAVETSDGWIGYTGGIRFHGQQPGLMEEFVQGFSELDMLALIVDGANTEAGVAPTTENDVYERFLGAVRGQDGLILGDFDALNMERLLTFHHAAETTRRKLVLSPRDVHMYLSMSIVWRQFPAFDAVDTFRILDTPQLDDSANGWEAELRSRFQSILVSPDQLRANGGDYIVRSSPLDVGAVDVDIPHSSGHASFDETIAMIRRIAPRHVIPVHSARPEAFAGALSGDPATVHVPRRGQPVQVA